MKDRLYNFMYDLNDILKDIDSVIKVAEIQLNGVEEVCDVETVKSILTVHLRLLKGIHEECEELYNTIDETILDLRHERI